MWWYRRVGHPAVLLGRGEHALAKDLGTARLPVRPVMEGIDLDVAEPSVRASSIASVVLPLPLGPVMAMRVRSGTRRARRPPPSRRPRSARRRRRSRRRARRAPTAGGSRRPGRSRSRRRTRCGRAATRCSASGPAAEPVAGSSATPSAGTEHPRLPAACRRRAKQLMPYAPSVLEALRGRAASAATSSSEPSAT